MKFWCASSKSSKQQKFNDSLSSSVSYATISSIPIPKSDSGYSETSSTNEIYSYFEQILMFERLHHENLKEFIIKYSRPLRRFLNSEEIVDLFQNIEKICAISQSVVRQCEKLLDYNHNSHIPISAIYQPWFGVMIDSYHTYISRINKARLTLKECEKKISYYLQISIEVLTREITEFILLPIRHICLLNDLFQSYISMNNLDLNIIQNVKFLSEQANNVFQSAIIVQQRTDKEPWETKHLELSDGKLIFTQINRTSTTISLSNVLHIEEDLANRELHLITALAISKSSPYSSIRMKHVYIRFQEKNNYVLWLGYLKNAVQKAKDQSWRKTNELII